MSLFDAFRFDETENSLESHALKTLNGHFRADELKSPEIALNGQLKPKLRSNLIRIVQRKVGAFRLCSQRTIREAVMKMEMTASFQPGRNLAAGLKHR
jgi:hypothetical protein